MYNKLMINLKEILMSGNPAAKLRELDASGMLAEVAPEIAQLRMPMPAHVHHKDNLTHSIQVLENAIAREANGPDLILRTAALLHDIGKPATRKFQGRKSVTFDGHESVGAGVARPILRTHGYSKDEIKKITQLIALHMRSHGFSEGDWTDTAVRRLITDVGDDVQLERLVVIFYADTTTKNKHRFNSIISSVTRLASEIARVKAEDARRAERPAINGNEVMEAFNIAPGRELGSVMRFLNTDEGIALSRDEAFAKAAEILGR